MNESALGWVAAILKALEVISAPATSEPSKWVKPDNFYELKASAGEDSEVVVDEWLQLDGRSWREPRIKWIYK